MGRVQVTTVRKTKRSADVELHVDGELVATAYGVFQFKRGQTLYAHWDVRERSRNGRRNRIQGPPLPVSLAEIKVFLRELGEDEY